jgi:hypothetical protein
MLVSFLRVSAAAALTCALVWSQNPYGRIEGRLQDASGAAVPGAVVRVVNAETMVATESVSNAEGNYSAGNLPPGSYRVTTEVKGFKSTDRSGIEVRLGDVLRIDIRLDVGDVSESVRVVAETPLLETSTSNLGQVVDQRRIEDLPLPAGNPMYLMQMTPGTVATNPPTHPWLPNAIDASSGVTGGGVRTGRNEFQLDGIPNMSQGGNMSVSPSPDIVQEVRVQTAAYDASVGHFTGLLVNMVIKSGTNNLHGTLFYSNLSRPMMGRDFFTNRSIYDTRTGPVTQDKISTFWPSTRVNHYRGTFSGPVYIPHVYDGRNRTFFLYGLDVVDRSRNEPGYSTVPTEPQRRGDFSALLALGSVYQIYDPMTVAPAAGGRFSRQPLAGNIVPSSRITTVSKNILNYFPLPNVTGTADGRNNYYSPQPRTSTYYGQTARLDQAFGVKNHFFATFTRTYTDILSGVAFNNDAAGTLLNRRHVALAVNDVITLRPDLVLELRAGVTRYNTFSRPVSFGFDLSKLGFDPALLKQLDPSIAVFPMITFDAYSQLGAVNGSLNPSTYYNVSGGLTWIRGNHTLKAGGDQRILRENNYNYGNATPRIDFASAWTKGPLDNSTAAPIGQGLASFLLGIPTGGLADRNASYAEQSLYSALYFQDDWKLTPRLTVTAGLRWEFESPTTERYARMNRGFDFTAQPSFAAAAQAAYAASPIPEIPPSAFKVQGGLLFAGIKGVPSSLWNNERNNFAPRIGFSWEGWKHTVVRGGYGIFYDSLGVDMNDIAQQGYNQRTNVVPSQDNGLTYRASLANPFPDGIQAAVGAGAGLSTFVGRNLSFFLPTRRAGYMQRWSIGVQKEVKRTLIDVAYVGNRGTGLPISMEYDPTPAQWLSTSPLRDQKTIDFLSQQVSNPYYGLPEFAGSNMSGKTAAHSQLLAPYSQFTSVSSTQSAGFSWYHSLQTRIERRFAQGYTVQVNYTWSRLMEATDYLNASDTYPNRGISPQDRPHVINVTAMYEIPFGKGKHWLRDKRWQDLVAGGWTVQGVYQGQSGPPLAWGNIIFLGNIKDITLPVDQRSPDRWFNTDAGFSKDSRQALASNIRTFPTRFNDMRGDGYNNWNLSIFKNFVFRERLRLQLRVEAIDTMNHALFDTPNVNPNNSLFGTVSNVVGNQQRQIFVGAKLAW